MELLNLILPSIFSIIIIVLFYGLTKGLGLLANNKTAMSIVSTIANNEQLRNIAKNLCVYAEKYVSTIAIVKLKFVVAQIENYCKQSGITITESQVLEIVQNTYDKNKDEIKSNGFIGELEKIFKTENNDALIGA